MAWHIVLFLFFVIIGTGIGFLFFFKKKGNRFANTILGIYTLLFSFELFYNCLKWSGYLEELEFVHFTFTHFPLWLIYGPLVYIFVRTVLKNVKFKKSDSLFLIPVILIIILNAPFYFLKASVKKEILLAGTFNEYSWMPNWTIWAVILLMFFYSLLTYHQFGPRKNIGFKENKWLKWFLGSYFGFVMAFSSYIILTRFNLMNPSYDYFVDIVIVLFIGILSFFGFVQPEVFEGKSIQQVIPFVKYRKTGLSNTLSIEMKEKLLYIMKNKKPYLESTLRLDDLALELNLSRNHTSQVINQHFNLSFFDFINKYRVEEAKKLLTQTVEKATVVQIAYDAGFNNRASFYKAFKKFENQNPTQYIKPPRAS
ncbi:AraC family transcriptional regulator [Flagellimonas sp. CMM7]|uniref:helix-turn-helix domain-containing protein n=1 Tax=Flagellimonas sp. CMM7 TaxID=2654676 RepID=UPI001969FFC3|nr:helix-turn-helix domain-containing protein [Flagellimonas sp. CMM7]UII80238.1 helix-turn-helix domain-containing protein [Flagellimonas sp. CMM7]